MSAQLAETILVVPCFNERARLEPDAFLGFLGEQAGAGFVFVDDGSEDGTWDVLEAMRAQAPNRIATLRLERNSGKAEAVRTGLLHVLGAGSPSIANARFVGYWDADLATPLTALPLFLAEMEDRPDCMLVMGSRVRLLGRTIVRKALRHYVGRMYATVASLSLDLPVYDTQCGAKVFRVFPGLGEILAEPFSDPWIFDVEMLARLRGLWGPETLSRIVELPLPRWEDVGGSKIRAKHGVRAALGLLGIWYRRIRT